MAKVLNVEERLMGMLAVEKRFISEKQLTECLNTIEFFEPDSSLPEIFLRKEYLTQSQIDRLLAEVEGPGSGSPSPPKLQNSFGEMCMAQNMINEDQLFQALNEQEKYTERGVKVQIGQIMVKMGFLTIAQVKRILDSQRKKTFYCAACNLSVEIRDYVPGNIYQCEQCQLDLAEAKIKKGKKVSKPKKLNDLDNLDEELDDEDFDDDLDDDMGDLQLLEL